MSNEEIAKNDLRLIRKAAALVNEGRLSEEELAFFDSLDSHAVGSWLMSDGITNSRSGSSRGAMRTLPETVRTELESLLVRLEP